MIQKIIKVGNSAAVTLQKKFLKESGFRVGQKVAVEVDSHLGVVIVKPLKQAKNKLINPEFKRWLDDFTTKNKSLLKKLTTL